MTNPRGLETLPYVAVREDGIDCDLSYTTLCAAICYWVDKHGKAPTVLRISKVDEYFATKLLAMFSGKLRLELRVKPDFADDEWAVGNNSDMGFGSKGA